MSSFDALVTVRRRRFASAETGFAVLDAELEDGTELVLVGPLVHLEDDERAHVTGAWVSDRRFGEQVKVSEAHPLPPDGAAGVAAYLRRVRHIGVRRADRLIGLLGAGAAIEAIDRDPPAAFARAGLSAIAAQEAAASWEELRGLRRLHLLLAPHGLARLAPRLLEAYGDGAARILSQKPYELTSILGVSFAIADRIARGAGIALDCPERAQAAVLHALGQAERDGSTCLPDARLLADAQELLEPGPAPAVDAALLDRLEATQTVVRDAGYVYRPASWRLEADLAERIAELLEPGARGRLPAEPPEPRDRAAGDGESRPGPTQEQDGAVRNAFGHGISLLTGGPGTGKTATIRLIGRLAEQAGGRVALVAPTGRAAMRMTEATGLTARTIHSALGWVPGGDGPEHDESNPLPLDLLIADECSMANAETLLTLLSAVGPGTHVVLVGDADQLAPVGAGKPFAELVASGRVPTTRLTHIFRQAAGSMIVQGAHAVREGRPPSFVPTEVMQRDLFLIERSDPAAALREIVSLVAERLPSHYAIDPVRDIQVFAPVYRGELGIDRINEAIRAALNPAGRDVLGGRLRIGDKVMLTGRNLHELGLMNGMLLRVLDEVGAAGPGDAEALLLGAEEAVFRLPAEEAERLRLAYACSVHRGQGIELPVGVIVAHPSAGAHFLRREMLYTALTRARLATIVVGSAQVLARAARTADTGSRHTRLAERLAAIA